MKLFKKEKEHTYFVSYLVEGAELREDGRMNIGVGNATLNSKASGRELFKGIVDGIREQIPNAIVINIVRLD